MKKNVHGLFSCKNTLHLPLSPFDHLTEIAHANSLEIWLTNIIKFIQDSDENNLTIKNKITILNTETLIKIYNLFTNPDYVSLINSLFFYKLHPQHLFQYAVHPEKLISIKTRLTMLYFLIEIVHKTVLETLNHRGFSADKDYLFHGNEMPQGISIKSFQPFQELILIVMKEWRLITTGLNNETTMQNKFTDLFHAYKFWFNPNCLIDAVMILESKTEEKNQFFTDQMLILYQTLSTTKCLDLYGCFSNKDSIYLMRLLRAAYMGKEISQFAPFLEHEKQAIKKVYLILNCVMNTLRIELKQRQVSTRPYQYRNLIKPVQPGRRNRQALIRIIELYCFVNRPKNLRLEQLFKVMNNAS